jgi:hypothetical protein
MKQAKKEKAPKWEWRVLKHEFILKEGLFPS